MYRDELWLEEEHNTANKMTQFHRGEYTVRQVKDVLAADGLLVRQFEDTI